MSWIKISNESGGIWAEEASPDPKRIVKVAELEAELASLEQSLVEVSKEPDVLELPNMNKVSRIEQLNFNKQAILDILKELNGD